MVLTPVIENFLNQVRQHKQVVSVNLTEATQDHMIQIKRTDVVRFEFVFQLDTLEHVPIDIIVTTASITADSYAGFSTGIIPALGCDCVVSVPTHNDRVLRDVNLSGLKNTGRTTFYIRPTDSWMVLIYGEYADEITPTDAVFLELIEKLKNVESVLSVNVEELLDYSILKEEERKIPHIFFRIKHTLPGVDVERYANFIMSEPSCCNVLEHPKAIEKVENLIKIETPEDQFENFLKAPPI
jgi:hypothetical protein